MVFWRPERVPGKLPVKTSVLTLMQAQKGHTDGSPRSLARALFLFDWTEKKHRSYLVIPSTIETESRFALAGLVTSVCVTTSVTAK